MSTIININLQKPTTSTASTAVHYFNPSTKKFTTLNGGGVFSSQYDAIQGYKESILSTKALLMAVKMGVSVKELEKQAEEDLRIANDVIKKNGWFWA